MTYDQILELFRFNAKSKGIKDWQRLGISEYDSFGINMRILRKLCQRIPRNHELAQQLWNSKFYECKLTYTKVEQPEMLSMEQIEEHSQQLHELPQLAACYAQHLLIDTSYAEEIANNWLSSQDWKKVDIALNLWGALAKSPKYTDEFFSAPLDFIANSVHERCDLVKNSCINALIAIGSRNEALNERCKSIAASLGEVNVSNPDNKPYDPIVHLNSLRVQKKWKSPKELEAIRKKQKGLVLV